MNATAISNPPAVEIIGDSLSVHFSDFSIPAYDLFLKVKSLPESQVTFDRSDETYTVTAPARFANLLGVRTQAATRSDLPFPPFLFDDQTAILTMALAAKRFACWSDCGLGKTLIQIEFARQVVNRTGGRVLLFTLNEIVGQTIEEAARLYGKELQIERIRTREEMRYWCKQGGPGIAITNYEKMNPGKEDQQVNELRYLAGVILDESSRLKGGGGKQKWALIKSCKGIEYKLSCTATPAPNDTIEFASQASFLEKMRTDGEIIWTYFVRDPATQEWVVKRHARKAFFEFMAAWSIYVRDPRKYGWRKYHKEVPTPIIETYHIEPTDEQRKELQAWCTDKTGQMSLLQTQANNAIQRGKLSQVAKGFVYLKGQQGKYRPIESKKPAYVADLLREEVRRNAKPICWTVFDAESTIIGEQLNKFGVPYVTLTGKTSDSERLDILERYRKGEIPALITRASMVGYGQNFQVCKAMVVSGWNDSYEAYYQLVRRAVRFGQVDRVRVHIPVIEILEGEMLENVFAKEEKHLASVAEMEEAYIAATRSLGRV